MYVTMVQYIMMIPLKMNCSLFPKNKYQDENRVILNLLNIFSVANLPLQVLQVLSNHDLCKSLFIW